MRVKRPAIRRGKSIRKMSSSMYVTFEIIYIYHYLS